MMNENTSDMTKTRRRSRKKQKTYHKTQEMEGSITQLVFILNTMFLVLENRRIRRSISSTRKSRTKKK